MTGGYIDPSREIGWSSEQAEAYCVGRMRGKFCRELFEKRFDGDAARRDLFELFEQECGSTVPTFAHTYVEQLNQAGKRLDLHRRELVRRRLCSIYVDRVDPAAVPDADDQLMSLTDESRRQEQGAFAALVDKMPAGIRPHLELGNALARLQDTTRYVAFPGEADPELALGDAAPVAGVPKGWLSGLYDWWDARNAGRWQPDPKKGRADWLDRFDDALTRIARRVLARARKLQAPLPLDERQRLLKLKNETLGASYVAESDAMLRVIGELQRLSEVIRNRRDALQRAGSGVRPEALSAVILGEQGTGKTTLARLLHDHFWELEGPFRRLNAAAFVGGDFNIAKGRLVGYGSNHGLSSVHEDGQQGLLEECKGGTLVIDEFLDLPHDAQTLLLDVLSNEPLARAAGGGEIEPPYPYLVFASNKDPEQAVRDGGLRSDLWDRMKSGKVCIPPLRERREDVFSVVRERCNIRDYKALLALCRHDWPDNVRGLIHELDQLHSAGKGKCELSLTDLRPEIQELVAGVDAADAEREVLATVMQWARSQGYEKGKRSQGLQKRTAAILGSSEAHVSTKLKKYGLT